MMSEEEYKNVGVHHFGDRVAIKAFATSKNGAEISSEDSCASSTSVESLLDRVKTRLGGAFGKTAKSSKKLLLLSGNKYAQKEQRRLDIGWLMKDKNGTKQVRTKTGGGSRSVTFNVRDTMQDVMAKAVELFFPNGQSTSKGGIDDYEISMTNFDMTKVNLDVTIDEIYKASHMKMLRVYLCTTVHELKDVTVETMDHAEALENVKPDDHVNEFNHVPPVHDLEAERLDLAEALLHVKAITQENNDIIHPPEQPLMMDDFRIEMLSDDEILFNQTAMGSEMDQLLDGSHQLNTTLENVVVYVKLHRGQVLEELENFFMEHSFHMRSQSLHIQMILPNGEVELAEDNGGVFRDALTEYWDSFYMQRTVGDKLKVPALMHTVHGNRWKSVGKIITVGYYFQKYFPIQLASCFLEYSMNGDTIPKDILLGQFCQYLAESERNIVEMCLKNYDAIDEEDLLDFLGDHNVRVKPSKENIMKIVQELSHKELIQCPTYVADCWREELQQLKPILPKRLIDMTDMVPTFKDVWASLSYMDDANPDILSYMKKYLKGLSEEDLKKFLRFCTGNY